MELPFWIIYLGSCLGISGGFYALFAAAEDALTKSKLEEIASVIRMTRIRGVSVDWKATFATMFDSIFSEKHWSWKCFRRSCLSSLIAVVALTLVWIATDREGARRQLFWLKQPEILLMLLSPVVFNFVPDFLSLLETRFILSRLQNKRTTLAFVLIDLIFTFLIAMFSFFLGLFILSSLEDGRFEWGVFYLGPKIFVNEALAFKIDEVDIPTGVFFYSTFLTSVWIWFYLLGIGFLRVVSVFSKSVDFMKSILDIDRKPLRSIGFVAMVAILVIHILVLPLVL